MEPRGYRMVVSTEQSFVDTCAIAERQLYIWLRREKRYDTSGIDEGRTDIAPHVFLDRDSASGQKGSHSRWRLRETPSADSGTWQSTLVVRSGSQEDERRTWVQVDVEHQPAREDQFPTPAAPPRLARLLLDTLEARDVRADVATAPAFIEADDVDDLIEELCDAGRRMPVVIASLPYGEDPDTWSKNVVEPLFHHLHGLAVLYVLTPGAQSLLNRALELHPVFGGGVRTYLPGIDPAWRPDAQRHPVMSRRTIEANPRKAAAVLAVLPQRLAMRQPLPAALLSVPRLRTRPRPTVDGADLAALRSENAALTDMLGEAERAESVRVSEVKDLYAELVRTERSSDELRDENEELYDKVQEFQNVVRFLRRRLDAAGDHSARHALVDTPDVSYPETFADLLDRLHELPRIAFTGATKTTRGLDSQSVDNWLRVAWDGLLALNEFAEASADGAFSGHFLSWCKSDVNGSFSFPAAKVKMRESDYVANNGKLRTERMLPVPETVDPSGQAFMQAHLRIGGGNTIAPRLHFFDDTPRSGLLCVGYLGPHLRNSLT